MKKIIWLLLALSALLNAQSVPVKTEFGTVQLEVKPFCLNGYKYTMFYNPITLKPYSVTKNTVQTRHGMKNVYCSGFTSSHYDPVTGYPNERYMSHAQSQGYSGSTLFFGAAAAGLTGYMLGNSNNNNKKVIVNKTVVNKTIVNRTTNSSIRTNKATGATTVYKSNQNKTIGQKIPNYDKHKPKQSFNTKSKMTQQQKERSFRLKQKYKKKKKW